jgi:hypothetical protein
LPLPPLGLNSQQLQQVQTGDAMVQADGYQHVPPGFGQIRPAGTGYNQYTYMAPHLRAAAPTVAAAAAIPAPAPPGYPPEGISSIGGSRGQGTRWQHPTCTEIIPDRTVPRVISPRYHSWAWHLRDYGSNLITEAAAAAEVAAPASDFTFLFRLCRSLVKRRT